MPEPAILLLIGTIPIVALALLFWPKGGIVGYIQRSSQLSKRVLREDALKHLHNSENQKGLASLESLAGALQISTGRAATLLEDLQQGGLVYFSGSEFRLTPTARDYALRIIRAHRLWERYLAEETGHEESKWHDMAERLEHRTSPDQANALSAQLGNPTHDPHGDPIPTAAGELVSHGGQQLTVMPLDDLLRIVHIEDEPETIYAQLVAQGLHPGMQLRLAEISPTRVRFWANGEEQVLAPLLAANISVIPLEPEVEKVTCGGEPLCNLRPGQSGVIQNLSFRLRGAERRRMMDLGILPGTIVRAEMTSPGGDPTAYRIRGTLIALRQEQAKLICIERQ